jgi:hypothetical protein
MKLELKNVLISFVLIGTLINLEAAESKYPESMKLTSRILDNNVAKPEENKPSIDHHYNTVIKKVMKKDFVRSSYPKVQSWNKDMTLIRISNRLYDANTLVESSLTSKYYSNSSAYKGLCSRNSDYFRWSNIESNIFYVLNSSNQFIKGVIGENDIDCTNSIESFRDYEVVHMGPHEGNIDYNDKYVVFITKKYNDKNVYVILFDIEEEKRVWTKELTNNKWIKDDARWNLTSLDWISISPSGKYILINESDANGADEGMYLYDINFNNRVKLQLKYNNKFYHEGGHGDMGYDIDGNEIFIQFISGLGVYQFSLDNPKDNGKRVLNLYGGGHISCRNTERTGWCYITTHGKNYSNIFALKLDGSDNETVQNFSQSHMISDADKIYGGPSPDGTKVIFNSDWESGDSSRLDTFVVTAY